MALIGPAIAISNGQSLMVQKQIPAAKGATHPKIAAGNRSYER
jgi:hypothetical protein